MTNNPLSAEQEKFEKNKEIFLKACEIKGRIGEGMLTGLLYEVRLQTLQEVQGLIEGEKLKPTVRYSTLREAEIEAHNSALSALQEKLSALIEQE